MWPQLELIRQGFISNIHYLSRNQRYRTLESLNGLPVHISIFISFKIKEKRLESIPFDSVVTLSRASWLGEYMLTRYFWSRKKLSVSVWEGKSHSADQISKALPHSKAVGAPCSGSGRVGNNRSTHKNSASQRHRPADMQTQSHTCSELAFLCNYTLNIESKMSDFPTTYSIETWSGV